MDIKNATVFITGANRGLGLAFAREAHRRGAAKVYAGMRKTDGFNEPGIIPVKIDVTDPASIAAAAALAADATCGPIAPRHRPREARRSERRYRRC
ncbi:SDR family NAD(P)-dependent oxidoreductase [Bradyrhizobium uaiense]|uniref:SDR family NAD(P)-dependent oxidoreductase n=1 Tax=Bradyrhizobium uaiense TaxID=2594946 RepID=UPI001F17B285|nr:SDR family NAD(P)-dependent oxidoreductase [Bradyrhizobium uaiense]